MGVKFEVIRPSDLVCLAFQGDNLKIDTSQPGKPALVVDITQRPAFLTVVFPPQTIAETAFFEFSVIPPESDKKRPDLDAGHGTEQNENSRKAIEEQTAIIAATGEYAAVHAVFLEEEPRIEKCYELAKTRNIIIIPFFISDGMHTQEDIPVLLGEPKRIVQERLAGGQPTWRNPTERNGKLVWYAAAVGTEPQMADIILERVREASNETL